MKIELFVHPTFLGSQKFASIYQYAILGYDAD
jgi:hypothetical protein